MPRELVVLGSASQVPTRQRNHNGYLLRWDADAILFDPGEGTQRQMTFAGVSSSAVTHVCVTHFHGDHCLGLPGVLQRMSLDGVARRLPVAFPAGGAAYFDRLCHASAFENRLDVVPVPVAARDDGISTPVPCDPPASTTLFAASLRHGISTVGWRLEEHAGRTMLPDRLEAAGVIGPDIARLQRHGELSIDGRLVVLDDVSVARPPQVVAFVMDTGWCQSALALARGADLLVCEATFDDGDAGLAARAGHLTASQAGRLAAEAEARLLVLTHFSQRYSDIGPLVARARAEFSGDVVAAEDLATVALPARRSA